MQGNPTAPAADAMWLSVAAVREPLEVLGLIPITGIQPGNVSARLGQAGACIDLTAAAAFPLCC